MIGARLFQNLQYVGKHSLDPNNLSTQNPIGMDYQR